MDEAGHPRVGNHHTEAVLEELVDRTHAMLRATPVVRRAAPALAAAWHGLDRSHALYETRRRAWQATHGRRRRFPLRVAFAPQAPRYFNGAYQLCVRLNVEIVPLAEADVILHWADATHWAAPPPGLERRAINGRVRDISKRHVNELHGQVFGYDLDPDPGATQLVEKSDANATHDGRIVDHPSGDLAVVTERLIDNRLGDHLVTDFRVAIMAGRIVMCACRYRPATNRFLGSGYSLLALVVEPDAYFSTTEQTQLAAMCEAIGADWAELDVLRDRASGRLYVVDVNPTAGAPFPSLTAPDLAAYWRLQEGGFAELLSAHAR